jgi:Raf kinase inhibitor-like YbhB/YbcL family protein
MHKTVLTAAIVLTAALAFAQQPPAGRDGPPRPGLTLTTSGFPDGGEIPVKYTQAVPNPVSPKLEWTNVPDGTVTFVLHMHDPDVARNRSTDDMLHWLVFNIPGSTRELGEGVPADPKLSDGSVQVKNGGGTVGYRGSGAGAAGPMHHYTWELYALDTKLDLTPDATRADVLKAIDGHILGKAILVGRFKRPAQ